MEHELTFMDVPSAYQTLHWLMRAHTILCFPQQCPCLFNTFYDVDPVLSVLSSTDLILINPGERHYYLHG